MVSSFRRWLSSLSGNRRSRRKQDQRRSWITQGVERLEGRAMYACLPASDLNLSPESLDENQAPGTTVGAFTMTAEESSGPFVYSFEGGPSNLDNENFFLTGDVIKTRAALDFESVSSYQVSIKATGADGSSFSKIFTIGVNDLPEAPLAEDDAVLTSEDMPVSGNVLANDTDDAGDVLSASLASEAAHGAVELQSDGSFTYTPETGYVGEDRFTYLADDGNGTPSLATVTITIDPVDDAPVAGEDAFTTDEDMPVSGNLLVNDTEADGQAMSATLAEGPANGSVELNPDGGFTYTPNADYSGSDSFTYTVADGNGGTATGMVSIVINSINDGPAAGEDAFTTDEDLPLSGNVLTNDTDIDGDSLIVALAEGPANGTLELNSDGSFTYTPSADFNGSDSFSYTVDDGQGGTATGVANITVNALNDGPQAADDAFVTNEDVAAVIPIADLLANDTAEGEPPTFVAAGGAVNGTVKVDGENVVFTPAADFNGTGSFTYAVQDASGNYAFAHVSVTVDPITDAPVAGDDAVSTAQGTPLTVAAADLLANDTDAEGDSLSITAVGGANDGTVSLAEGNITFTPDADFSGTGTFYYVVTDGNGGNALGMVSVEVAPAPENATPEAMDDAAETSQDTAAMIAAADLLANDFDADGDPLSILNVGDAIGGEVSLADGTVTFTPQAGFTGAATFSYTLSDGRGGEATGMVTVNVTPVEQPPVDEQPGEELPGEGTPDEEVPGEETPTDESPGEDLPGEELPGEETPDEQPPVGSEDPDHCDTQLSSQLRSRWLHLSRHWS